MPLNTAMEIITDSTLGFNDRRFPEGMTRPGITARYDVPMAWVSVPYLEGAEAEVAATLARIAPGAVPLGLCGQSLHGDANTDGHLQGHTSCRHEEGSSLSEEARRGNPSFPLSAAGSEKSSKEVKFPCADAGGPAADVNAQPEAQATAAMAA